jgi:hypothetical protein
MRKHGISFCIIAGGNRQEKLDRLIASIHCQRITTYEIIVAGAATYRPDVIYVPMEEAARTGRTSLLRNSAAECSKLSHIVFSDDDIVLAPTWFAEVVKSPPSDLLSTRLLNLDGTRHWDWATSGGPRGLMLLDYGESDPYGYCPGGLLMMRADVWGRIRWDQSLGYGEAEDVALSREIQKAGVRAAFCHGAIAIHNDHTYTQIGRKVPRRSSSAADTWLTNRLQSALPGELGLRALEHVRCRRLTDAVDCLRYALYRLPSYESAAILLEKTERGCGGPVESGRWRPTPIGCE